MMTMLSENLTKKKGFTLIEIMIVLAIIAVITAIAIPSLLQARMNSNEVSAISALRSIAAGQNMYIKEHNEFASSIQDLSTSGNLPDDPLTDAESTATTLGPTPINGYYFAVNSNYTVQDYMFYNVPATYNVSGRFSYFINPQVTVYQTEVADTALNIIDLYDDANDWDANVDSWSAAK